MADSDKILKILLEVQSDIAPLQQLNSTLGETKQKLQESGDAGVNLNSAMAGFIGGAVAGAIGVVANTLAQIPQRIAEARQEVAQWTADIANMRFELADQEEEWLRLAQAASNFGDVAQISQKLAPTLADAAAKMEEFRSRELGFWARWADTLASLFTAPGFVLTKPFQTAMDKARKDTADTLLEGINAGNDALYIARQSAEDWAGLLSGPVDQGIAKVRANIEQLKGVQSDLDLKRLGVGLGSTPDQLQEARAALDQSGAIDQQLLVQEKHLDQLTRKQDEQTSSVKKTAQELETLTAKRSQDAETIATAAGNKAYEQEIEEKKKLGILDADAIAKANQIRQLMHDNVLAQQQHTSASAATKEAHRDIVAFLSEESALLRESRQSQQLVQQDPFLSFDQKNAALLQLIPQEIAEINAKMAEGRRLLANTVLDPATVARVNVALKNSEFQLAVIGQKMKTLTFGGQLRAELVQLGNQLALTGAKVGQVFSGALTTAIGGVSSGITNLITGAGTFAQAWNSAVSSVINQFVQLGVETAVYYGKLFVQWAIQKTLATTYRSADVTEHVTAETTKAGASGISALLTSISSWGWAAVVGLAAVVAAVAYFAVSGFESGGYTGDGHPSTVAGVVHRGEYVVPKSDVDRAGGPMVFDNMRLAINRGGYERGGSVGGRSNSAVGRSSRQKLQQTLIFFDAREMAKHITKTKEWETSVVHLSNSRGGHLRT